MKRPAKVLEVRFYKSDAGRMPVQEWLKGLSRSDKKTIGEDLKTVEFYLATGYASGQKNGERFVGGKI